MNDAVNLGDNGAYSGGNKTIFEMTLNITLALNSYVNTQINNVTI